MRTAREHAEELRQEAIRRLLVEKAAVEEMLARLGYRREARSSQRRDRLLTRATQKASSRIGSPLIEMPARTIPVQNGAAARSPSPLSQSLQRLHRGFKNGRVKHLSKTYRLRA